MEIGIFVIDMISKDMNVGGNVFGPGGNILGLRSIDVSHIVFKISGLNIAALE